MNECNIADISLKALTAIISLINLIFIIRVHHGDKRDRKTFERNQKKIEWYKSLRIRDMAIDFVDRIDKYINDYYYDQKKKNNINLINDDFLIFKKKFIRAIICFDKSKEEQINIELNEVQDDIVSMSNMITQKTKLELVISKKDEIAVKVINMSSKVI